MDPILQYMYPTPIYNLPSEKSCGARTCLPLLPDTHSEQRWLHLIFIDPGCSLAKNCYVFVSVFLKRDLGERATFNGRNEGEHRKPRSEDQWTCRNSRILGSYPDNASCVRLRCRCRWCVTSSRRDGSENHAWMSSNKWRFRIARVKF